MSTPAAEIRLVTDGELVDAVRVATHAMLGPATDEHLRFWAERLPAGRTHASLVGGSIVGTAKWFPTELSTPGGSVGAAAVTAVGVLPTHRRQGHLTALMAAQLDQVRDEGLPVAILIAAEWGIYGRYGYGPAIEACGWELDAGTATFLDPPEGTLELVDPPAARADLARVHDAQMEGRPGVIRRDEITWDLATGIRAVPGSTDPRAHQRSAQWRDPAGTVQGVVRYDVDGHWERNRPRGRVEVRDLYATTPTAERELWRHLCSLDWVTSVKAGGRPVDDHLPLWLADGRAAVQRDRFDHIWARILDVPGALAARCALTAGDVVVEVTDPGGYAQGRWHLVAEGGEPIEAVATTEAPDLTLPAGVLGACYLGGHRPPSAWAAAGRITEHAPGAAAVLDGLLASPVAPWCPTNF